MTMSAVRHERQVMPNEYSAVPAVADKTLGAYVATTLLWLVKLWVTFVMDVFWFWKDKIRATFFHVSESQRLLAAFDQTTTYEEWEAIAIKLDTIFGNDVWRQNPASRKYDYRLIASRLNGLLQARQDGDINQLLERLRSGLLRNLGSIANAALYNRAYSGTKLLIEDYVGEVLRSLDFVDLYTSPLTSQDRLDFFHDTRQSFGRTALILHGGSLFGLCHVGVVKSLSRHNVLPKVVCGAAVGALVAALVCLYDEEDLDDVLNNLPDELPPMSEDLSDIKFHSVAERVVSSLCPPEIFILEHYVCQKLSNITFEEAYRKSGRVLNIIVTPKWQGKDLQPVLLNYLTAPNVLVASAARASVGTGVLHSTVSVLERRPDGSEGNMFFKDYDFSTPNTMSWQNDRGSSYLRLSELFNVNSYIVSVARPYFAPFLLNDFKYRGFHDWRRRLLRLFKLELHHRLMQLDRVGLIPPFIRGLFFDEIIPGGFQVTIVPQLPLFVRDFGLVLDSHNIKEKCEYWIMVGERSVWPFLSIIWSRCAIEYCLHNIYESRRLSRAFVPERYNSLQIESK